MIFHTFDECEFFSGKILGFGLFEYFVGEDDNDLEWLKQFETYKTEAYKPKCKIKEARVEALCVGLKQC